MKEQGSSCTPTLGTWRLAAYGHHIPCLPPCVGFLLSQPPGGGVYKFSTKLCSHCQVFSRSACKIKACCKPRVVICYLCPAAAGTDLLLTWLSRNLKALEEQRAALTCWQSFLHVSGILGLCVCSITQTHASARSLASPCLCLTHVPAPPQLQLQSSKVLYRQVPCSSYPRVCLGTEQGCSVVFLFFFFYFSPFPFPLSQAASAILYCGHSLAEQGDEVLSTACAKACFGRGRDCRVFPS